MANDSKSGSRKINQHVDLAPGARNLTTTGNITAGAFYGDGSHLTGISTAGANDALITITAGGGLTGGGGFTVDQAADAIITVSHSDTSAQDSVANTVFNVIQSITLDTYGHITAIESQDIGTAGFYVKTTGETGVGQKIGLGSLTYQTVQFFAGTGLSVVRTDNEIQFSAPNAANWNTAYGWGNHAGLYASVNHTHIISPISETSVPSAGISIQAGPGSNNTQGWAYPYGTRLSAISSAGRSFEIMSTTYPNGELVMRTLDGSNVWDAWKTIIDSGNIGSQSVNYATYAGTATDSSKLPLTGGTLSGSLSISSGSLLVGNYSTAVVQSGALNIGRIDTNYGWDGSSWAGDTRLGILANCSDTWEFGIHDSGESVESVFYYNSATDDIIMGRDLGWGTTPIVAASSFRAPVFYDSNDTNYKVDPTSVSTLNAIDLNTAGTAKIRYMAPGEGTVNIGAPFYNNASFGAINIAMTDNDTGGIVIDNEGATIYGAGDNGEVFRVIDEDVWQTNGNNVDGATTFKVNQGADGGTRTRGTSYATGDHRAPIFYDSDNTGYYVNPSGTSVMATVSAGGLNGTDVYTTGGWFRNHTNSNGIYWSQTGWHLYPESSTDFYLRSGSSSEVTLKLIRSDGTPWGYIHNDSSRTIGFLNYNRNWISYTTADGNFYATSSSRAPIFYDSDNTGFYMDLTSSDNSIRMYGSVNAASNNKPGLLLNSSGTGSDGAAFGMQQVTAEGWTGIFVDYEPYTGWGLYHDNPNNYFSITSETTTGQFRSFTVPSRSSGNRTAYEKIRFDQNDGAILAGGRITSYNSMESPIFYDSNNTGYYVDPASTSVFSYIQGNTKFMNYGNGYKSYNLYGMVGDYDQNSTSEKIIWTIGDSWNSIGNMYGLGYTYGAGYDHHLSIKNNGSTYHRIGFAGGAYFTGAVEASASHRAPIFYDSNDTGYYLNPQGFSNLGRIKFNDVVSSGTPVGDAVVGRNYAYNTLELKGYGAEMMIGSQSTDIHINYRYCNNTGNSSYTPQNWYWRNGTGSGWSDHYWGVGIGVYSLRSSIFYDYDNTGYYVNPDATTNINNLYVQGGVAGISNSSSYTEAALEIRERNFGGAQDDTWATAPRIGFHWGGRVASQIAMSSGGWINIMNNPGNGFESFRAGAIYSTGDVTAYYSDVRLKDIQGPITNALDGVLSIETFKYKHNEIAKENGFEGDDMQLGVSAQSVEAVFPELVKHAPFDIEHQDGVETSKTGEWYKTVKYERLVPVLIEAMKEQQKQIEELKAIVDGLTK